MDDILLKISQTNVEELDAIINAVIHRHSELYPQWDLNFLALPPKQSTGLCRKIERNHYLYRKTPAFKITITT